MDGAEEHDLVIEAFACGLTNAVIWTGQAKVKLRDSIHPHQLTTTAVTADVREIARTRPGEIKSRPEKRPQYRDSNSFVHEVWLPYDFLGKQPLYVEMLLARAGDEPVVHVVSCHPSTP